MKNETVEHLYQPNPVEQINGLLLNAYFLKSTDQGVAILHYNTHSNPRQRGFIICIENDALDIDNLSFFGIIKGRYFY